MSITVASNRNRKWTSVSNQRNVELIKTLFIPVTRHYFEEVCIGVDVFVDAAVLVL